MAANCVYRARNIGSLHSALDRRNATSNEFLRVHMSKILKIELVSVSSSGRNGNGPTCSPIFCQSETKVGAVG